MEHFLLWFGLLPLVALFLLGFFAGRQRSKEEVQSMMEEVRFALGVPKTMETSSWPHLVNAIMVDRVIAEEVDHASTS